MIAKIVTGNNVNGLLRYLTKKEHKVVTSNHLFPDPNIKIIAKEILTVQGLNKRAKKNLSHIVLSFPKHENIDDNKLQLIVESFMKKYGAQDNQWITFRHYDTDHTHCHTVLNKVNKKGKLISDSNSFYKAKRICRELEVEYNLTKVSSFKHTDISKNKTDLKVLIDEVILNNNNINGFKSDIEKNGYKVNMGRGIAFVNKKNGVKLKGSDLGRDYSLSNILKALSRQNEPEKLTKPEVDLPTNNNQDSNEMSNLLEFLNMLGSDDINPGYDEDQVDLRKKRKRKNQIENER